MVIISSVDDLASSQPLAADAAARASQPKASNPEPPLFDDLGTAAYVAAGTTAWNSYHPPPPYAPTAPTSGAYNPSSLPSPTTFFPQPPPTRVVQPAIAEPSYCWYPPTTQLGFQFQPCFAPAPFVQGAVPPPVLVPMQITRVEPPSYHPQTQGAAAASAAEEAAVARAVPDTHKPQEQEATKPAPRRRGRPRKNAAATGESKPVFKPPKRATARSNRAASQQTTSVADTAAMAAQIQVQKPDQQAASSDDQTAAPCMNTMAALLWPQQWQLQPTWTNAEEAMPMPPYAETSAAGVRFQPTDEELIFYLRLKHAWREMPVDFFKDLDVYHEHPETTKAACVVVNDFWYAFSPRNRKYKNGDRPARSVIDAGGEQVGYWKSNTKLAPVRAAGGRDDGALIGKVTSLTFHLGRQPNGIQTPWKMKEYAIPENQHAPDGSAMRLNDWVVCKLFYKERAIAAEQEDQLGEAGENVSRAEGDEGSMTQVVSTDQTTTTLGSSEQDLCVEDYLGHDETFAQQNHGATCNILQLV